MSNLTHTLFLRFLSAVVVEGFDHTYVLSLLDGCETELCPLGPLPHPLSPFCFLPVSCPWTGTAIGRKNMMAFQFFVCLVFACMILDIFLLTGVFELAGQSSSSLPQAFVSTNLTKGLH